MNSTMTAPTYSVDPELNERYEALKVEHYSDARCTGCGLDVIDSASDEVFMVWPSIWIEVNAGPAKSDWLCVGCVEDRLGRQLTWDDFDTEDNLITNALGCKSPRLLDRLATLAI